jgi:hypothetical protein
MKVRTSNLGIYYSSSFFNFQNNIGMRKKELGIFVNSIINPNFLFVVILLKHTVSLILYQQRLHCLNDVRM